MKGAAAGRTLSLEDAGKLIVSKFMERDAGGVSGVLARCGYVQIDSINVVQRAHHHVLWNRIDNYHPDDLATSELRGEIFEYWAHAAAYLPIESYRFCLPRMKRIREQGHEWFTANKKTISHVHDRIRDEGPLMARDFRDTREKSGTWWDWKPAKIALEHLFHDGTLLVRRNKNFQKVYDLRERVLPSTMAAIMPTEREMARYLIDLSLKNQFLSRPQYLSAAHRDGQSLVQEEIDKLLEEGSLVRFEVEDSGTWYCRPDFAEATSPAAVERGGLQVRILSPFDNLVIRRSWLEDLFGFRYRLECYLPRQKRTFGYFSLPVLASGGFAGQADLKADRKRGVLIVRAAHFFAEYGQDEDFAEAFDRELKRFADFNGCPEIEYE